MSDPGLDLDRRGKRGRGEIRIMMVIAAAVLLIGAVYVLMFGSPSAENRGRDDPDRAPGFGVSESDAQAR
jgi:hypothetical protein